MKCDELKEIFMVEGYYTENSPALLFGDCLGYGKEEVDEAIAELKAEINRKEAVGQRWFEQCMEARTENVRLKRALWRARAEWARSSALSYHLIESHPDKDTSATYKRKANKWEKVKDKCLKKAEEYK